MDFTLLKGDTKGPRLGKIGLKQDEKDLHLQTPACLLYTKSGCIPQLTHDMLPHAIYKDEAPNAEHPVPLLVPISNLLCRQQALEACPDGILQFVGMQHFPGATFVTFCCQNDPAKCLPSGYNNKNSVAVWGYSGKFDLTPTDSVRMAGAMKPAVLQLIADTDVGVDNPDVTSKRLAKAVAGSLKHAEESLKLLQEKKLKVSVWGTALANLNLTDTKRYIDDLNRVCKNVSGYVLDGFNPSENLLSVESEKYLSKVTPLIQGLSSCLPPAQPRLLPHVATPSLVIAAVEAGVDLFDSSFAVVAAERGGAFVFRVENDSSEDLTPPSDIVEMNLNQKEFAEDFGPILRNCTCYTCQTHTRAYLHHLLNTCELLAPVLLMVHNQYHYLKFFSCLRKALQANRWQEFRSRILSHLHEVPSGLDKRSSDDVGGDVGVVGGRKQKLKRITS